jgi:aryl-alcohol dehydrogenase-like predicted oxidoreductase
MNFGWGTQPGKPETDEETAVKILNRYTELGGNFIDTADGYGAGKSEELLGRWMTGKNRNQFVIVTKAGFPMSSDPNSGGSSRRHLVEAVDASLKRLQTDFIDVFLIHKFDKETTMEETFRALNDLVKAGKIRYIGVSNYRGFQMQKAWDYCHYTGLEPVVALQIQYNLMSREVEWECLKSANEHGIGVMAWSPLKSGWLGGKYTREMKEAPKGSRAEWGDKGFKTVSWQQNANDYTWNVLDAVKEVGTKLHKTSAQVSLRWLLQQQEFPTFPIIGPKTVEQAEENLQIIDWSIPQEDFQRLDKVSKPTAPHPYDFPF